MNTVIETIDPEHIDGSVIRRAGDIIRNGGIVAFPTETVYGLGGNALDPGSASRIYEAKGRPSDNPLIVHIADIHDLGRIVDPVPEEALALAEAFWPGPLTMIMKKSGIVPERTTGGLDTVAVRFPSDPVARALIAASGGYIAAPSANISGRPSPTSASYVIEDMDGRVDMILCGDDSMIGLESTIVDLTSDRPQILRPGYITREELETVLPGVIVDPGIGGDDPAVHPKAPGMKYRHYAPRGEMTVVDGSPGDTVAYINEKIQEHSARGLRCGVITVSERVGAYTGDLVLDTGASGDINSGAHRLFSILRRMDDEDIDVIYAEAVDGHGVGFAYMNRLMKAAGGNIVYLGGENNDSNRK